MTSFNLNGKRTRSTDDDVDLQHPEQKKIFSALPFRTSPTIQHTKLFSTARKNTPQPLFTQTFTQTITPTESEDEISPKCAAPGSHSQERPLEDGSEEECHQEDIEMAMASPRRRSTARDLDLDSMMLSPKPSPMTVLPDEQGSKLRVEASTGGRMPTPIYGHFQSSPIASSTSGEGTISGASFDMDYENHMRARRLPTPISEDEAMDTFNSPDEDMNDAQSPRLRQPARFPMPSAPITRRNKPVFSMGFRADCDLCRNRVPGHYNHIFWS